MIEFIITSIESGKMLKQVLQNRFHFSRRLFRRLREEKRVMVNDQIVYYTARLMQGDRVSIRLEEAGNEVIVPQKIDFEVVYEDHDLLIIDKPVGIVVHPTLGYADGTLANGVAYYAQQNGESYPFRPVTRLDKDTSGIMVIAKHAHAHAFLSKQMTKKRYERRYVAICHGEVSPSTGTIHLPIGLHPESIIVRTIDWQNGKEAITNYEVIRNLTNAALLSLKLETGRTHQIRVHLAAIGHPIMGDTLYGSDQDREFITRQALHAKQITLFHPSLRQWMSWETPIATDMVALLEKLHGTSPTVNKSR